MNKCQNCKKMHYEISPWCKECNQEMDSWVGQPNQSNDESSINEISTTDYGTKTQSGELKSQPVEKHIMQQMPKDTAKPTDLNITPIKKNEMNNEPNGHEKTRSVNLNTNETITEKMPTVLKNSSMSLVTKETQLVGSMESLKDLKTEISASINLLSQSEQELLDSMKGLRSSQPEPATRLYDPERVQTAVMCARQISESMKAKLELLKFAKGLE